MTGKSGDALANLIRAMLHLHLQTAWAAAETGLLSPHRSQGLAAALAETATTLESTTGDALPGDLPVQLALLAKQLDAAH